MRSIKSLRNTAKEILAAAVLELFPGALLVEGGVTETAFWYAFHFPLPLFQCMSPRELTMIEERMCYIAYEKRPFSTSEMMKENASQYLQHLKQPLRAQIVSEQENPLVTLVKMGHFSNVSEGSFLEHSGCVRFFHLLHLEKKEEIVTFWGVASDNKKSLRDEGKNFLLAIKNDPLILGSKQELFRLHQGKFIFLPKGEELRANLKALLRQLLSEQKFCFLHAPLDSLEEGMRS